MIEWLFAHTPLYLMTQSFWQDEAFSYFLARLPVIDIIKKTAADFNPPLYYILLHFWMSIFSSSEVAMRSLSLIFFAGTTYIFSLFLETIFNIKEKKALLYSILFLLKPDLTHTQTNEIFCNFVFSENSDNFINPNNNLEIC
jgi:hypothetical protein